jgi:hypothetical protein
MLGISRLLGQLQLRLWRAITEWLINEPDVVGSNLSDFDRLRREVRPADVVLIEGRSRVSEIIKIITLSSWSHAALYIGRVHDIEDPDLREYLAYHYRGSPSEPLLIEALLGEGTIVAPLSKYKNFPLRICRAKGLSHADAEQAVRYCIGCLSLGYDVRQFLDLARFMFPYGILPRRWRSSLFEHNTGIPTQTVCSTLIAEAFREVNFPILPLLVTNEKDRKTLKERNTKLVTPRDFDYSPYFEIVKYPMLGLDELAIYRRLPWDEGGAVYSDKPKQISQADTTPRPELETAHYTQSTRSINMILKSVFGKSPQSPL